MLAAVKALAGPDGVEHGRRRMCGLAWGARRSPAQPAVVVSDEQIIALVAAARALSQRQRRRLAAVTSVEADERLLRLEWAVWAGRAVPVDDEDGGRTPTASPRSLTGMCTRIPSSSRLTWIRCVVSAVPAGVPSISTCARAGLSGKPRPGAGLRARRARVRPLMSAMSMLTSLALTRAASSAARASTSSRAAPPRRRPAGR